MRDVNSQDIVQGVVNALRNEFGDDDYTYYIEDIPQGFKEPSFYIRTLNSSFELVCGRRYLRENMIIVRYFPKSEMKPRQEINAVAVVLSQDKTYTHDEIKQKLDEFLRKPIKEKRN